MRLPLPHTPARRRAFTLIELLTVIAIIGILAGILIPTMAHVQITAKKTRTKVMLGQWALAMETFRTDYSYYPLIDGTYGAISGNANVVNPAKFAVALTGKLLDGTALPSNATPPDFVGNLKRRSYYSLTESELVMADDKPSKLKDAFGNTEIAVLYDTNGDGSIKSDDKAFGGTSQTAPALTAANGGKFTPDPTEDVNLTLGIRAGVIFYSPGNGNSDERAIDGVDAVFSWK